MWAFIIGLTGVGLANSIVALVEVLSSVKYVCVDSDDDMVTAAQVLDWSRAISGFLLCVVVGYGYSKRGHMAAKDMYYNNVSAVGMALMATLFLGVIQQSEACHNCISEAPDTFSEDTRRMLGGARCSHFRMVDFKIPENYCRDQLQNTCGVVNLPPNIYAERCLVYSCSSLPHGFSFRYIYGIFGMMCQLCVCLVLLMHESLFDEEMHQHSDLKKQLDEHDTWQKEHRAEHDTPDATAPPPSTITIDDDAERRAMEASTRPPLYPRRRNAVAYSRVSQIEF